jgi:adenosine/AMP kinase
VRFDGNDESLIELAKQNALALGAGHTFIVFMDGGFPVNCLNAVKAVPEICRIHCATANPTAVIIAKLGEDRKVRGMESKRNGVTRKKVK